MKREGPGWRLAFDRYREGHQALIGGDGWALELSDFELQLLRELCLRLLEQHQAIADQLMACLLYTSPSPRDGLLSRMPSSA